MDKSRKSILISEREMMKDLVKGNSLCVAIAVLVTSSAAMATGPSAGGIGTVSASTSVAGAFNVGNNGSSTSYAHNRESAMATITAMKGYTSSLTPACDPNVSASASILGATKTQSAGVAHNTSTGSGTGNALSAGRADTAVSGTVGIHGVTSGYNGGKSGTHTDNLIKAGVNQGSYIAGETVSGFEAQVAYNKTFSNAPATTGIGAGSRTATVDVTGYNSGYASGANASGALENMNAAGIANIGSSGHFFGKTNLSGSTGYVSAR